MNRRMIAISESDAAWIAHVVLPVFADTQWQGHDVHHKDGSHHTADGFKDAGERAEALAERLGDELDAPMGAYALDPTPATVEAGNVAAEGGDVLDPCSCGDPPPRPGEDPDHGDAVRTDDSW